MTADTPKLPPISKYDRRFLHLGGNAAQVFTDSHVLALYQRIKAQEENDRGLSR